MLQPKKNGEALKAAVEIEGEAFPMVLEQPFTHRESEISKVL